MSYFDTILQPIVMEYAADVGLGFMLMHNNPRPHTSRLAMNFLDEHGIYVLQWPA